MGSSLLSQIGKVHIVRGVITGASTDTAMSVCNDGSCTVAGSTDAGVYTLTFGEEY